LSNAGWWSICNWVIGGFGVNDNGFEKALPGRKLGGHFIFMSSVKKLAQRKLCEVAFLKYSG